MKFPLKLYWFFLPNGSSHTFNPLTFKQKVGGMECELDSFAEETFDRITREACETHPNCGWSHTLFIGYTL